MLVPPALRRLSPHQAEAWVVAALDGFDHVPWDRVVELHVAGGDGQDVELSFKLVNFVQIVGDFSQSDGLLDAYQKMAAKAGELAVATLEEAKAAFAAAYQKLAAFSAEEEAQGRAQLDALWKKVRGGP